MRRGTNAIAAAALALSACNQRADQSASSNAQQPVNPSANQSPPAAVPPPATGPDARTPLAEPKGPIDAKSAEAAGQVVQHYGALIEQGRWEEAGALWNNLESGAKFAAQLRSYAAEVHLEIGNPGEPEGAAGSIYVTIPIFFYGDAMDRQPFRRSADVILRRVNDVPGSTDAQRRWHIERIDVKPAG
jgi:hypothetical protein